MAFTPNALDIRRMGRLVTISIKVEFTPQFVCEHSVNVYFVLLLIAIIIYAFTRLATLSYQKARYVYFCCRIP